MMMVRTLACGLAALALADGAAAQRGKLGKFFEDARNGYRFKTPADWDVLPVNPAAADDGMLYQSQGAGRLYVFRLDGAVEPAEAGAGLRAVLDPMFGRLGGKDGLGAPAVDRLDELRRGEGRFQQWRFDTVQIDTWSFALDDRQVALTFLMSDDHRYADSWRKIFARAADSFEKIEREEELTLGAATDYDTLVEYYEADASRTPGWRALPTPSEKFVVLTSHDDKKFLDEVIDRLEQSRLIFEQDYPPPEDFTHVSVVRVCGDEAEFHRYGGTAGGVAGWFSPTTKELVLYDAQDVDRNMTYAVVTHEAFHQYCHFLFGQSEAHRWFDEGHGDYYGGIKFSARGKPVVKSRMPAGLNRLEVIKAMVRDERYAPLAEHVRFNHRQWQTQGPSNVSCYSQSWSIVYMLRQGVLGKVHSKVWEDEYGEILPSYISTLREGFADAYKDLIYERELAAAEEGRELTEEEREVSSDQLDEDVKLAIWDRALAASWDQIDLEEFEENWCLYVKKYLKD